eukprot:1193033-Prorocentrum_minimum.AAC.1
MPLTPSRPLWTPSRRLRVTDTSPRLLTRPTWKRRRCVPQIPDEGKIVIPKGEALAPEFRVEDFQGRWYISSGLNKDFDIFDCQVRGVGNILIESNDAE